MVLNIYLFRHGETKENAENTIFTGRSNHLLLTNRGIAQAEALGNRLKKEGIKFDILFSSTAVRSLKTAEIIANIMSYPQSKIITSEKILEIFHGDWEGKTKKEVYTEETINLMGSQGYDFKPPKGESQREVEERVYGWLKENILNRNDEDLTIGVVTHGMVIKCLTRKILNHDSSIAYRTVIDNCSITQLQYRHSGRHNGWTLVKINDSAHLLDVGRVNAGFV